MTASLASDAPAAMPFSATRTPVGALAVEMTYACNQACAYCYNPSRGADHANSSENSTSEVNTALLLRRLERLSTAWDISLFTVTGGEPLRHPGLFEVLDRLHRLDRPVQIITNGTVVTEALARRLSAYGLAGVQITLNGPVAELHREHVGRDSFEEATRGVRYLIEAGVAVVGCIVVTRKNAAHVDRILEVWRTLGVERIALSRFSPAGMSLERMQAWLPRRQDLMTAFEQARRHAEAGVLVRCTVPVPACLFDVAEFAPIEFGQCAIGSPYQEFALGPDGALRLCTLHAGRLQGGRDVLDSSWDLSEVPRSKEISGYRARLPTFCAGCSAAPACLGGCGASMPYRADGEPRALDPLVQQYFDEGLEPSSTQWLRPLAVMGE